jgi:hypothetical protein
MSTILVLLQNAYGVKPGYVPDYGLESFARCHTGKRLREALPDDVTVKIRNCSPLVGRTSDSFFAPDIDYVREQILDVQPDVILACGKSAHYTCEQIVPGVPVVKMPHPAFRALSKRATKSTKELLLGVLNRTPV